VCHDFLIVAARELVDLEMASIAGQEEPDMD
jgi:hypothetical protein